MAKFAHDPALCTGCHACEVACAIWHGIVDGGRGYRYVKEEQTGVFPAVTRRFVAGVRRGCDLCATNGGSPRCASTCPTGALTYR